MGTLKPQSNSNTAIGTLAVDGWAVTFGTARRDWVGPQPAQSPIAVLNVTAHQLTVSVPITVLLYRLLLCGSKVAIKRLTTTTTTKTVAD